MHGNKLCTAKKYHSVEDGISLKINSKSEFMNMYSADRNLSFSVLMYRNANNHLNYDGAEL